MAEAIEFAVMLCVRDLARSRAFYVDTLGASAVEESADIILVRLGGTLVYLFTESPPTPDKPTIHLRPPVGETPPVVLVLRVDDAAATYTRLRARGMQFLTAPMEPRWGGRRCFGVDPDGYVIEIEQPR